MDAYSKYERMVEKITFRYKDKIEKQTSILKETYGIKDFYYFKIKKNGDFFFIGSYAEWSEYFVDNKFLYRIPYYRHPDFFRDCTIPLEPIEDPNFSKVIFAGKETFNITGCFAWFKKIPEGLEAFGIFSQNLNRYQNALLYNELPVLKAFAENFMKKNRILFDKGEENLCNLCDILGNALFHSDPFLIPKQSNRGSFLEKSGIFVKLSVTEREKEVLARIINGFSASEIGEDLSISKRTAEHHIERIKMKFQCESKKRSSSNNQTT